MSSCRKSQIESGLWTSKMAGYFHSQKQAINTCQIKIYSRIKLHVFKWFYTKMSGLLHFVDEEDYGDFTPMKTKLLTQNLR